jgi:hypothetical protein
MAGFESQSGGLREWRVLRDDSPGVIWDIQRVRLLAHDGSEIRPAQVSTEGHYHEQSAIYNRVRRPGHKFWVSL